MRRTEYTLFVAAALLGTAGVISDAQAAQFLVLLGGLDAAEECP
ncbi:MULTISPECIES: hypothetical protein [Streptomyces]|nr:MULTISPECIES: hypothetical protein [unclassified Streptomyces]